MSASLTESITCFHCGETCSSNKISIQEKKFCCEGCKLVYEILKENNLCTYYDLNSSPGITQRIQVRDAKFAFLDDVAIQQKLIQFTDGIQTQVNLLLPQMHCSSCLWLLENLHKIHEGVITAKVNFTKKELFIVFDNQKTTLRKVVETLTAIGYEPYISLNELDSSNIKKVDKSKLYKLGIAGFCFANIMMMSFPEYLSYNGKVEENIKSVFTFFIVLLSLPVFFYCANEFFISAWKGIKHKFLNIDAPIALAILITFGRSLYEIFSGTGSGYLDSMSGIVFFMLLGRILQDKTYQSISFDKDYKSFFPIAVNVLKNETATPTSIENVKTGDVIQVFNNEIIPVDAILSKGNAEIDYSFVTGESLPVYKEIGELIYAGGRQISGAIELIVVKEVLQSYLTNLWNKDVFKNKAEKNDNSFIHLLSKYFTYIVLVIASSAALFWFLQKEYTLMWNTLTTVLIVACPCALLLSATFTNGNILRILSKNKLYLRHPSVIETLASVNHLVFDKTGTITQQKQTKVIYQGKDLTDLEKQNIASLMAQSSHPLSKSVTAFLEVTDVISIRDFKSISGEGIEGWIDDKHYRIGSFELVNNKTQKTKTHTSVFVKIDKEVLGEFQIVNQYRFGFNQLMNQLKDKFDISVISGDNAGEKENIEAVLGKNAELLFNQKPDEKLAYIQHLQTSKNKVVMMIGDGLNDAGALKQSNAGIAISENTNNFTPACDGILDASQFSNLHRFIQFAVNGKHIIIASFILSILYNVIGLYFAVQGILTPLIAAILMPSSSITIILLTYGMSEIYAWKNDLKKT